MPAPQHPTSAQREYQRHLNEYANTYIQLMKHSLKLVVPDLRAVASAEMPTPQVIRMDENIQNKVERAFETVMRRMSMIFPVTILAAWSRQMIGKVGLHSKRTADRMINHGKSEDEKTDFIPLMVDHNLTEYYQNKVDENVGLIKSIPSLKLEAFKNQLVSMITADLPSSQIQKAIQNNFDITRDRARLIAVDQVGKLNGQLEEFRQKQLGLKRYIWRNSGDSRVAGNPTGLYPDAKPSHWDREGKIYYWSDPPAGGHPKQRIRCRCWAQPIPDDIIDK